MCKLSWGATLEGCWVGCGGMGMILLDLPPPPSPAYLLLYDRFQLYLNLSLEPLIINMYTILGRYQPKNIYTALGVGGVVPPPPPDRNMIDNNLLFLHLTFIKTPPPCLFWSETWAQHSFQCSFISFTSW